MYIYPRVCYKGGDCRITRVSNQKLFGNIYTFKGVSQRFKQRFLIQTIPASSEYILVRAYFLVEYTMNLKSSVRALVCHILTYISINTNALMHDMFLKFYIYIYIHVIYLDWRLTAGHPKIAAILITTCQCF